IVSRQEVGDVVSFIEQEGVRQGISARVSDIEEEQQLDQFGNQIAASGPLVDVRLTIMADGPPENLVSFLHSMEHMPYLSQVDNWEITTTRTRPTTIPPAGQTGETDAPRAALFSEIIISVDNQ
ncbi:MAG: hypothetical protein ACRD4B_10930, partial [Acidobacteriota bacterium]